MAKITINYDIHLGDEVNFMSDGNIMSGTVQDLTWLPSVFIETGDPGVTEGPNAYKRHLVRVEDIISIKKSETFNYDEDERLAKIHIDGGSREIITAQADNDMSKRGQSLRNAMERIAGLYHLSLEDKEMQPFFSLDFLADKYADMLSMCLKGCNATSLMHYLDENRHPDKKMCLSNGECEQIDKAFAANDWKTIIKYIAKYIDNKYI